jgi:hypothetical protein
MRSLADRFWEKVQKLGPDDCWPWLAGKNGKGYGSIRRGGGRLRAARPRRQCVERVPDRQVGLMARLCIDCKHHRTSTTKYECHHPSTASPVTGKTGYSCESMRSGDIAPWMQLYCGPDGELFEVKAAVSAVQRAVMRSG